MDALITLSRIMLDIPADPVVKKTGSGLTPILIIAVVAVAAVLIWKFYGKKKGA